MIKLKLLAKGIMSIPAVKGFEIGSGFSAAELTGEENADEIQSINKKVLFKSNNSRHIGWYNSGQI